MQISADQYRLLSAFESGKPLSLKQVRETDCPAQTLRQMWVTASELQRNRPPLLRRLIQESKELQDDQDSVWDLTLVGYLLLMELQQSQRVMAQRNRCFRRPDGTDVYYRILRNRNSESADSKVVVQVRQDHEHGWQVCARGLSVSQALAQAQALGFEPEAS